MTINLNNYNIKGLNYALDNDVPQFISPGKLSGILVKALIQSIIELTPITLSGFKNMFVPCVDPLNDKEAHMMSTMSFAPKMFSNRTCGVLVAFKGYSTHMLAKSHISGLRSRADILDRVFLARALVFNACDGLNHKPIPTCNG